MYVFKVQEDVIEESVIFLRLFEMWISVYAQKSACEYWIEFFLASSLASTVLDGLKLLECWNGQDLETNANYKLTFYDGVQLISELHVCQTEGPYESTTICDTLIMHKSFIYVLLTNMHHIKF